MSFQLTAYEHPVAARKAVELLHAAGVPSRCVRLHVNRAEKDHAVLTRVDEQVSGGLTTNLFGLFGDVFEWGDLPIDTSAYAATVRRGGAVVEIRAANDDECGVVNEALAKAPRPDVASGWVAPISD